jgi:ABC-type transport system substrate-binding protein
MGIFIEKYVLGCRTTGRAWRLCGALFAVLLVLGSITSATGQQPGAKPGAAKSKPSAPPAEAKAKPSESPEEEKPSESPEEEKPPAKKFYEQEKYDLITLDKANDNAVLQVLPLDFPERKIPEESKRVGKLKVRLFDRQTEEYEVAWRNIERIDFFEELVLQETNKIVSRAVSLGGAGKVQESQAAFDEAYEFFQFLLRYHPNLAGLQESLQEYLYLNAGALFQAGRVREAFAILEELYLQNREYRYRGGPQTVLAAAERVGDHLIATYADARDYRDARLLLERLQKRYGSNLAFVGTWRDRLMTLAAEKRDAAAAGLAAKRFQDAHDLSREMLKIWPNIQGGRELILEIARQFPLVVVGVSQPARAFDPQRLADPAAKRCGYLMYRTLVQYADRGPEGGRYISPWGTIRKSADRTKLFFDLRPSSDGEDLTAFDLARHLLSFANSSGPDYLPSWAAVMSGVEVEDVQRVRVDLQHPSVMAQALLQVRLPSEDATAVRYRVASQSDQETRFEPVAAARDTDEPKPVIVERYYAQPRQAISDLRMGKIDVVDRLLPNDAMRLRQDPSLVVDTYGFPSIHVLVPNTDDPFLDNRTFRRALVYAINRQIILEKGLLDGKPVQGCRVLSAPLTAGITSDDPSAYAYDERLEPLPYDPVMAAILLQLAEQQLAAAADKRQEPAPELKELVLAYPAGEQSRFVCNQIQTQLDLVGVKCSLRELPPGQATVPDDDYDLLYAELMMREPLVDAGRLLGPGGLVKSPSPYVGLTLRRLDRAENWKEARERLYELHSLLYEDVTILPLWQMIDYFAYHRGLQGVRDRPVFLYQDVEQWRVVPPTPQE